MYDNQTLIKWPGGKTREIKFIEDFIPCFERYIEPFFGGGALFFHLQPKCAAINDISEDLMTFYSMAKSQDKNFYNYLMAYYAVLESLLSYCDHQYDQIFEIYAARKKGLIDDEMLKQHVQNLSERFMAILDEMIFPVLKIDKSKLQIQLISNVIDKIKRTVQNEEKVPFNEHDLSENLIAGFVSGIYMYFRDIYNDIRLKRISSLEPAYRAANFYFVREFCYGSMFRYNSSGEFNIPYGGMSYNRKNYKSKIDRIFSKEISDLFQGTELYNLDFEQFISRLDICEKDFMFLDPPYDTDFSDYEGRSFTHNDQIRLANTLKQTKAKFVLIIKNTDFIYSLYKDSFPIYSFDKTYTYNVRSRNERKTEHLIITNVRDNMGT